MFMRPLYETFFVLLDYNYFVCLLFFGQDCINASSDLITDKAR